MQRIENEKEVKEAIKGYFKKYYDGYKVIDIQLWLSEYAENGVMCRVMTLSNHCINKYYGEYDNISEMIVSMKFQDLFV